MDANSSPHRKSHDAAFVSRASASASPISPRLNVRSAGRSNSVTGENLAQLSRVAGTYLGRLHSRHRTLAAGALVLLGMLAAGAFGAPPSGAAPAARPAILSLTT